MYCRGGVKVSRELDAEVAEKVMGWQWFPAEPERPNVQYLRRPDRFLYGAVRDSGKVLLMSGLPAYSTDIAAAWLVVDHLRERGIWLEELTGRYETSYRAGFMWRGDHPFSPNYVQEFGDTAPLAICRAALAACAAPSAGEERDGHV